MSGFTSTDLAELERHAVKPEVAEAAGVRSSPDGRGLVIPWPDTTGYQHPIRRIHKPLRTPAEEADKYKFVSGRTPGLKFTRDGDPSRTIVVEGHMQSLAVASWAPPGYGVLGMQGADGINNKNADAVLGWASGSEITLVFDADRRTNVKVRAAVKRVTRHLMNAGAASVRTVDVPGSGSDGIDDVLARIEASDRTPFLAGLLASASDATVDDGDADLQTAVEKMRLQREARRILEAEERGDLEPPEILTLRERLERPREPLEYRIEGWQPASTRVVLAAQKKAGKTTLVGNLVRILVDGGLFLGRDPVTPIEGKVALLDFEMSAVQVEAWLADQGITADDRVVVVSMRGNAGAFDILDDDGRAAWVERLGAHGIGYLVLDCLRPVLDSLGLDENHEAGRFLVPFDELLSGAGIGEACIVHHMGHENERSRGDSRIGDWPDVEWRLVREDENPSSPRYLSAFGRDVDQVEQALSFDAATRHLTVARGSRIDVKLGRALDDAIGLLGRESDLSKNRIEEALGSSHEQKVIRQALEEGARMGAITRRPGPNRAVLHSLNGQYLHGSSGSSAVRHEPGVSGSSSRIETNHHTPHTPDEIKARRINAPTNPSDEGCDCIKRATARGVSIESARRLHSTEGCMK